MTLPSTSRVPGNFYHVYAIKLKIKLMEGFIEITDTSNKGGEKVIRIQTTTC